MMKFAKRRFGEQIVDAWMDFNQDDLPDPINEYPGEEQIFMPYFLFDWDPKRPASRRGKHPMPGVVAQDYLLERGSRLTELEGLILARSIAQPLSLYEVVKCDPGRGMTLRDVLIGGETEVEEHSGSKFVRQGDILYAQMCPLPGVTALSRMAPTAIPPGRKVEIVALRAKLRRKIAKKNRDLASEDLTRYAEAIRTTYLNVRDAIHTPPKLANTDGDLLVFHALTFRVGSAQVAFDALASLAWGESKEELLDGAEVSADGTLLSVNFDWRKKGNPMHKTWDNTILGHLKLSGSSLVVEVNSANRARKIREEIEKRLGILARHQSTRSQTPEEMLAEKGRRNAKPEGSGRNGTSEPQFDPEVWQQIQAQMQEEVETWIHRKLPVLGGRTPVQAIKVPDGREIVEGLLLEWERSAERPAGPGTVLPDVAAMRRLLNL